MEEFHDEPANVEIPPCVNGNIVVDVEIIHYEYRKTSTIYKWKNICCNRIFTIYTCKLSQ